MQTIIWNTYNSRTHSNILHTTQSIIETFNQKIRRSLQHFIHAMKQTSYIPSRWECPRLTLKETQIVTSQSNWQKIYANTLKTIIPNQHEQTIKRTAQEKTTAKDPNTYPKRKQANKQEINLKRKSKEHETTKAKKHPQQDEAVR